MDNQNIAIRLKFLIENLGISNSQFADECNISRPTLSQLITGRNKKVSDVIVGQIHKAFPTLSIMWLLFGEGEVWNGERPALNKELPSSKESDDNDREIDYDEFSSSPENFFNEDALSLTGNNSGQENPRENLKFPAIGHTAETEGKENAVKHDTNTVQNINDKDIIAYLKKSEILDQIANLKPKSRKVVHVTIYYDDSTFETFYPGQK